MNGFFGIVVRDFLKQFADGNFHAQFLADFADEALLESFARLRVCRREIPKVRPVRARVALRDQQFAVAKNQSR